MRLKSNFRTNGAILSAASSAKTQNQHGPAAIGRTRHSAGDKMNNQPRAIVFCIPVMKWPVSQDEPERLLPRNFMPPLLPNPNELTAPTSAPALALATGRIEGRVLRSDTQALITDASVFIASPDDPDWLAWDITIDHGVYAFTEVKPGDYSLTLVWDQSGRFQDDLDEIIDFDWEGDWLVTRGQNGVVVATACLTVADGEVLCKDWEASFTLS
jgi:hypothetical protein